MIPTFSSSNKKKYLSDAQSYFLFVYLFIYFENIMSPDKAPFQPKCFFVFFIFFLLYETYIVSTLIALSRHF